MLLMPIKNFKGRAPNTVQLFSTEDTRSVEIPIFLRDALTEYHQIVCIVTGTPLSNKMRIGCEVRSGTASNITLLVGHTFNCI